MKLKKRWNIKSVKDIPQEVLTAVENPFIAKLLVERGLDTSKKVQDFLYPEKMHLMSPYVFSDMKKAVDRILQSVETQEKIVVWGDFDADGVTATAVLCKTLKKIGANFEYYIPNRESENHGLNSKALLKLISQKKVKLIITVDCGISNLDEIKLIKSFKVDTIITDHHESSGELPDALAILNPKAENALSKELSALEIENLTNLAGVGVAFKLALALLEKRNEEQFALKLLPLVATGTIADVVPLVGENRCFVKLGLKQINDGENFALKKMLDACGYGEKSAITSENIAFGVAPRINASGRLGSAETALRFLISEDEKEIDECIKTLDDLNKQRQDLCEQTYNEALEILDTLDTEKTDSAIILFKEDWHIGVVGIVASKFVESFNKPAFLMTKDPKNPSRIRCSARSIPQVHLYQTLEANKELIEQGGDLAGFGGHALAAGLSFNADVTSFEQIKSALELTIKEILQGEIPEQIVDIDLSVEAEDLTPQFVEELEILQPFGEKNPSPVFCIDNLVLKEFKTIGSNNNHLKFFCGGGNGRTLECIWWGNSQMPVKTGGKLGLVFAPKVNIFNDNTTVQLIVKDLKFDTPEHTIKVLDHRKKTGILQDISNYIEAENPDIVLFSEYSEIAEELKSYKNFSDKIINRTYSEKASQIMFFDYPVTREIFDDILKNTSAKKIHLMSYNPKVIDPSDFIKKLSGMMRFASSKKEGKIEVSQLALLLNVDVETIVLSLELFEDIGMIKVLKKNGADYELSFVNSVETGKIKSHPTYDIIASKLENIFEFQKSLETSAIEELQASLVQSLRIVEP